MKRFYSVLLCISLMLALAFPAHAAEVVSESKKNITNITVLGDGVTVIDEIFEVSSARSTDKTYTRRRTFEKNGTTVGIIAITALFRYDGNSVYVISKAVTQTDTYEGWNYKQNSFTSSGGTVTLDAKLTKLLVLNIPFTMTLTCDKNGNISYS